MTEQVPDRTDEVEAFWALAREHAQFNAAPGYFGPGALESVPPPAWAFGGGPEQADELLTLVLDGTKRATTSALWDYEAEGEPLPETGNLGIVLDGAGHPRALVVTTRVEVVPFDEVTPEQAALEAEGDRSLAHWRRVHEEFFRASGTDRAFASTMPVVFEEFEVLYPA